MENFTYRFKSLELLQFATLADTYDPDNITIHNELRYMFDETACVISCLLSVTVADSATSAPILKAEMMSGFEIKKEGVASVTKGDEVVFPAQFIAHLAALTYSSMRGAINVKAENTAFSKFILPAQNIQDLIKKPFVYKKYSAEMSNSVGE